VEKSEFRVFAVVAVPDVNPFTFSVILSCQSFVVRNDLEVSVISSISFSLEDSSLECQPSVNWSCTRETSTLCHSCPRIWGLEHVDERNVLSVNECAFSEYHRWNNVRSIMIESDSLNLFSTTVCSVFVESIENNILVTSKTSKCSITIRTFDWKHE